MNIYVSVGIWEHTVVFHIYGGMGGNRLDVGRQEEVDMSKGAVDPW